MEKGPVFVCLFGDKWPVSTRWLVCTIKLSKRKDFSLIVAFGEELWNSELSATAGELAGVEGEGQSEFSAASSVPPQRSGRMQRQVQAYFLHNCACRKTQIQRQSWATSWTGFYPPQHMYKLRVKVPAFQCHEARCQFCMLDKMCLEVEYAEDFHKKLFMGQVVLYLSAGMLPSVSIYSFWIFFLEKTFGLLCGGILSQ